MQGFIVHLQVLNCTRLINIYVDIVVLIVFTGLLGEFDILHENTSTQGVVYEYKSVMHPGLYEFAKEKKKTIVPLKLAGRIYGANYPTTLDIFHMRIMYCEGNEHIYSIYMCIC